MGIEKDLSKLMKKEIDDIICGPSDEVELGAVENFISEHNLAWRLIHSWINPSTVFQKNVPQRPISLESYTHMQRS
mgnify:CR=1 FL=1